MSAPSGSTTKWFVAEHAGHSVQGIICLLDTWPFMFGTDGWCIVLLPCLQLGRCGDRAYISLAWLGLEVQFQYWKSEP